MAGHSRHASIILYHRAMIKPHLRPASRTDLPRASIKCTAWNSGEPTDQSCARHRREGLPGIPGRRRFSSCPRTRQVCRGSAVRTANEIRVGAVRHRLAGARTRWAWDSTPLDAAVAQQGQTGHRRAFLTTGRGTRAETFYRSKGWQPTGVNIYGEMVFSIVVMTQHFRSRKQKSPVYLGAKVRLRSYLTGNPKALQTV